MTTPTQRDRDERISLPLDPETVLRALLKVDPDAPPVDDCDDEQPSESSEGCVANVTR